MLRRLYREIPWLLRLTTARLEWNDNELEQAHALVRWLRSASRVTAQVWRDATPAPFRSHVTIRTDRRTRRTDSETRLRSRTLVWSASTHPVGVRFLCTVQTATYARLRSRIPPSTTLRVETGTAVAISNGSSEAKTKNESKQKQF